MRNEVKSGLLLAVTFGLGAVVGAIGAGAYARRFAHPADGPPVGRFPGGPPGAPADPEGRGGRAGRGAGGGPEARAGFVENMEALLAPMDSSQAARLRPYFEAADASNHHTVDGARAAMRLTMDSLLVRIGPMLSREQRDRFDAFVRGGPGRAGPPGLGTDGRRGGPPGRAPPP